MQLRSLFSGWITFIIACYLIIGSGCRQSYAPAATAHLEQLLHAKDFFRLRNSFNSDSAQISPEKRLLFRAFIDNAFNGKEASVNSIQTLLHTYPDSLSDSLKTELLLILSDNYFKSFDYARAAVTDNELLTFHQEELKKTKNYDGVKNDSIIRNALKDIPQQSILKHKDAVIPWEKDKLGLVEIPLTCAKTIYPAIFDTRANLSSINATYAKKLSLRMLPATIKVSSGITGNKFNCGLAVADSLYIGDILVRNSIFIVMPDSILYFSELHFSINIILGFPVIAQLKEIHLFQNRTMVIPEKPTPSSFHNLFLDGQNPIIAVASNNDTLPYLFDSGASSSDFFSNYFRKYKAAVIKNGSKQSVHTAGAGGMKEMEVYKWKNLPVRIANKNVVLKEAIIHTNPTEGVVETFYGNLGQDLITQFKEMILNFDSMYIDFK